MNKSWLVKTIGELAGGSNPPVQTGPFGSQLHADDYVEEGVPFILIRNIGDSKLKEDKLPRISLPDAKRLERYSLKLGDIVFSRVGRTGSCLLVTDAEAGWIISGQTLRLRLDNPELDQRFLLYVLRSPAVQDFVAKSSVGTTRESLNTKILKSIPILHPVYSEQMRVAEILAELDEGIEQTEVLIAKHRRIKLGLMQDLFTRGITSDVRLRPTRARAPHLYRKSPLGWIPEDWDEAPAKKLCQPITKGTTPIESPPPEGSSAIPFLRVQNLSFDGRLEFDEDRTYVSLSVARGGLARSRVFPGDVLMNIVGPPLGKVSMVPETFPECNINQAIAIFRPLRLELRSYLRWYLLSDIAAQWFLRRVKRTSGQVNITLEMCSQLPVPYPRNVAEIGMITDRLDGIQGLIESEEDHRHKLGMIKSGLMHDLLSGRVRVNVGGAVTT